MNTIVADVAASTPFWIAIKATILLGVAAAVQGLLHRRGSAARHFALTLGVASVLVLPVVTRVAPQWDVPIPEAPRPASLSPQPVRADDRGLEARVAPPSPGSMIVAAPVAEPASAVSWWSVIVAVYVAGLSVMLIQLLVQREIVRRLARRAAVVHETDWTQLMADCVRTMDVRRSVRLLRSREHSVPVAFGTWRPAIVIPAIADSWSEDRRRAVLLHELAHVARCDYLTQMLALAARAMYWFHPAAWWTARRLRIERELACDDRVIAAGTEPREYAGHLLEIAYSFGGLRMPALAVGMARRKQLEGRMLAALDSARNRRRPGFKTRVAAATVAAALLGVFAGAAPANRNATGNDGNYERAPMEPSPQVPGFAELRDEGTRLVRAVAGYIQDGLPGTWEIRPTTVQGTVHLRLVELNSSSGSNVRLEQLEGLSAAQLTGAGGPVQFRLRRDAGTFTFEGVIRSGVGAGTFSFAPDPNFPAELAKRGFSRPTAREQYQLARHDIGFAFVDELNKQGYAKPDTSELVRAGQHGVQVTYLREMGALGYRLGSLQPLVTLRDHGITPDYIRELAELGYKGLPADDLQKARDHGITAEYVRGMREAGYGSLTLAELINARDHGVTPEFVRELGDAGHRKLPLEQIVRTRDHGVTPEYVREMRRLGHAVPLNELVNARDHGIDLDYVREIAALGYSNAPLDTLIRMRDHGVTPDYVKELKALGYDKISIDDLVSLRDHGMTADRIRKANERAGSRLPIDLLKSLAAGGMR